MEKQIRLLPSLRQAVFFPAQVGVPFIPGQRIGAVGCMQSHCAIIERCITDDQASVLILEDDCLFVSDFEQRWPPVKLWLDQHSDAWDIFNGAATHWYADKTPIQILSPELRILRAQGRTTHFIYLQKRSFKPILEAVKKHFRWNLDDLYCKYFVMSTCLPFLTIQASGKSTITGRTENYSWLFEKSQAALEDAFRQSSCIV